MSVLRLDRWGRDMYSVYSTKVRPIASSTCLIFTSVALFHLKIFGTASELCISYTSKNIESVDPPTPPTIAQ